MATTVGRLFAGALMLSLVLAQLPTPLNAAAHGCAGTHGSATSAMIGPSSDVETGCTHAVACGPSPCCSGSAAGLPEARVWPDLGAGTTPANVASGTLVHGVILTGPPTPPPNN